MLARAKLSGAPRPNVFAHRKVDTARFAAAAELSGAVEPEAVRANERQAEDDDVKNMPPAYGEQAVP
jgi:hypothetical protein